MYFNKTIKHQVIKFLVLILLLVTLGCVKSDKPQDYFKDYPITPISFTNVTIEDDFWKKRLEINEKVTIPATLKKSEETGRISNFAKAGGLEEGEFQGIFFDDSDVFKIVEGASYSLRVNSNPDLKKHLDEVIHKIASAQEDDGYLYTNRTINPQKAADGAGKVRWTGLEIFHELYNVGHLYEAAVAHYEATGERKLLDVAIKNANLVESVFGPNKNIGVPGHQEIEIGLVKLYRVTGEKKYLDLAKFFIDQKGRNKNERIHNDFKKTKLYFKNNKITKSSKIHEFFYEQSNYKVGASENNLQIDIDKNREELFNNYYFENNSEKYDSLSNKKFLFFEKIAQNKLKFNLNKKFIYSLSIFGFVFFLGFLLFFISQSKTNKSKITIKPIVLEKGF